MEKETETETVIALHCPAINSNKERTRITRMDIYSTMHGSLAWTADEASGSRFHLSAEGSIRLRNVVTRRNQNSGRGTEETGRLLRSDMLSASQA